MIITFARVSSGGRWHGLCRRNCILGTIVRRFITWVAHLFTAALHTSANMLPTVYDTTHSMQPLVRSSRNVRLGVMRYEIYECDHNVQPSYTQGLTRILKAHTDTHGHSSTGYSNDQRRTLCYTVTVCHIMIGDVT